jgi:hypothetical protein
MDWRTSYALTDGGRVVGDRDIAGIGASAVVAAAALRVVDEWNRSSLAGDRQRRPLLHSRIQVLPR